MASLRGFKAVSGFQALAYDLFSSLKGVESSPSRYSPGLPRSKS